jgi:hypothetical protein
MARSFTARRARVLATLRNSLSRFGKSRTVNTNRGYSRMFLVRPLNSAAKEWIEEYLPMDNFEIQFWGDAIVIVEGILADKVRW